MLFLIKKEPNSSFPRKIKFILGHPPEKVAKRISAFRQLQVNKLNLAFIEKHPKLLAEVEKNVKFLNEQHKNQPDITKLASEAPLETRRKLIKVFEKQKEMYEAWLAFYKKRGAFKVAIDGIKKEIASMNATLQMLNNP